MKQLIAIVLCMLLVSCVTVIKPVCRHWALFAAITYSDVEKVPVRIGIGHTGHDADKRHAQAEAFIDGEWVPIAYFYGKIRVVEKDNYYAIKYHSVKEFSDRMFKEKNR